MCIICIVHVYGDTHICNVSVAILCSSFVITMSMWPSQININQKDVALPAHATQDEILNAMLLWDMPLETYPAKILDAKLKWYIDVPMLKWYIDVPAVPDADPVTVDLQRQAFVVGHIDGAYYSFWNSDEFPLGQFYMMRSKKTNDYMQGCNHTSALCAWLHAKNILKEQYPIEMNWQPFNGSYLCSQPSPKDEILFSDMLPSSEYEAPMELIEDDEDEMLEHPSSNASPSAPAASAAPDAAAPAAAAPAACPEMSMVEADVSDMSDDHDEELDADMNAQQLMGKCNMLINKHKKVKQKQKQ